MARWRRSAAAAAAAGALALVLALAAVYEAAAQTTTEQCIPLKKKPCRKSTTCFWTGSTCTVASDPCVAMQAKKRKRKKCQKTAESSLLGAPKCVCSNPRKKCGACKRSTPAPPLPPPTPTTPTSVQLDSRSPFVHVLGHDGGVAPGHPTCNVASASLKPFATATESCVKSTYSCCDSQSPPGCSDAMKQPCCSDDDICINRGYDTSKHYDMGCLPKPTPPGPALPQVGCTGIDSGKTVQVYDMSNPGGGVVGKKYTVDLLYYAMNTVTNEWLPDTDDVGNEFGVFLILQYVRYLDAQSAGNGVLHSCGPPGSQTQIDQCFRGMPNNVYWGGSQAQGAPPAMGCAKLETLAKKVWNILPTKCDAYEANGVMNTAKTPTCTKSGSSTPCGGPMADCGAGCQNPKCACNDDDKKHNQIPTEVYQCAQWFQGQMGSSCPGGDTGAYMPFARPLQCMTQSNPSISGESDVYGLIKKFYPGIEPACSSPGESPPCSPYA